MTATRSARRNGGAPSEPARATAPELKPEPEPVSGFDLDAAIEQENGEKATKVYRETTRRAPLKSGGFACLAREQHIAGSEGEYLVKLIRVNEKEPLGSPRRESAQYVSAEKMRDAKSALASIGVKMWKDS